MPEQINGAKSGFLPKECCENNNKRDSGLLLDVFLQKINDTIKNFIMLNQALVQSEQSIFIHFGARKTLCRQMRKNCGLKVD